CGRQIYVLRFAVATRTLAAAFARQERFPAVHPDANPFSDEQSPGAVDVEQNAEILRNVAKPPDASLLPHAVDEGLYRLAIGKAPLVPDQFVDDRTPHASLVVGRLSTIPA